MTKMKDTLMVRGIGIQFGQYCWERLHKIAHEISMKDFGYTWFIHEGSNIKRLEYFKDNNGISMLFYDLVRDTLVVFH